MRSYAGLSFRFIHANDGFQVQRGVFSICIGVIKRQHIRRGSQIHSPLMVLDHALILHEVHNPLAGSHME